MSEFLSQSPSAFAHQLQELGGHAYVVLDPAIGELRCSHPELQPLVDFLNQDTRDHHQHEGLYFSVGRRTGALLAAFIHWTSRGQAAGGVRHWPYQTLEGILRDGLRLSCGMTRKNALAGLWWGGGKGIIQSPGGAKAKDRAYRDAVYQDYGDFITGLRGLYVTAEDVGTTPVDMAEIFRTTRHATCVPPEVGGSGNPSHATARGVVSAMEGALAEAGLGELSGKRVVLQGAGNVATFMMEELLQRGVRSVLATDISQSRLSAVRERLPDPRLELRCVSPEDLSVFSEPCDILAPCALGGTLNPTTIAMIQAPIVCGAANNQLLNDHRDDGLLAERGIIYVPDYLANRMGIVHCANEHVGFVPDDPAILRHLGREWDNAVYVVTRRVLHHAKAQGITTSTAANQLADELAREPHPIWPRRGLHIQQALTR